MGNPHIKFEVYQLNHSHIIAQKPFSDGATGGTRWHHLMPVLENNLPCIPHTKFEVNQSTTFLSYQQQGIGQSILDYMIAQELFSDGTTW